MVERDEAFEEFLFDLLFMLPRDCCQIISTEDFEDLCAAVLPIKDSKVG